MRVEVLTDSDVGWDGEVDDEDRDRAQRDSLNGGNRKEAVARAGQGSEAARRSSRQYGGLKKNNSHRRRKMNSTHSWEGNELQPLDFDLTVETWWTKSKTFYRQLLFREHVDGFFEVSFGLIEGEHAAQAVSGDLFHLAAVAGVTHIMGLYRGRSCSRLQLRCVPGLSPIHV